MSAALAPELTQAPLILQDADPLRDKTYREARSARAVVDWLAWLELGGLAARTLDQYERDLSRLCLAFPSKELEAITDGDVAQVLRTFPEAGRRVRKAAYDNFFKWARRSRRIPENPMELLPTQRRKPQKYVDVHTTAEKEALCALGGIDGVLCTILFEAGLRKAEARNLRVRDTNLDRRQVIVHSGKGDRDRVISMSRPLWMTLADHLLTDPLAPAAYWWPRVFANAVTRDVRHDKPCGDGTFSRWWGSPSGDPPGVIGRAGVRYLKPHSTRHWFATDRIRRGLSTGEVKVLLGHASIATTEDIYVHLQVEDIASHWALIEAGE